MGPKELAAARPEGATVFCVCENRWKAAVCERCEWVAACKHVNAKIQEAVQAAKAANARKRKGRAREDG